MKIERIIMEGIPYPGGPDMPPFEHHPNMPGHPRMPFGFKPMHHQFPGNDKEEEK